MAKEQCDKKGITFTRLLITAAILLAGCVSAFTVVKIQASNNGKAIEANKTEAKADVVELEIDGCKPTQKHGADMKVVEYRLDSIDKGMGDFRVEQQIMRNESKQQFEAIMKKL
ncbi:MAG TPA: hypothetical protein ENH82_18990 [bacterium]|nr:hypothetical protein [bacterium]